MSGIRQYIEFLVQSLAHDEFPEIDGGLNLLVRIVVQGGNLFLLGQEFDVVHFAMGQSQDTLVAAGSGALSGRDEWIVKDTEVVLEEAHGLVVEISGKRALASKVN